MIKICILILLIIGSNVNAVVPAKDSSAGAVLESAFSEYGACYLNFLVWGSDIPDENNYCNIGNGLIVSAAITAFAVALPPATIFFAGNPALIIPSAIGTAAGVVSLDLSITFAAASAIANEAHVCRITPTSQDVQPAPYTNSHIEQLLKRGGEDTNIENIIDKYNKLCIEYHNSMIWLKQNECGWIDGAMFCAFSLGDPSDEITPNTKNVNTDNSEDPDYLCGRVSSTCPCVFNLEFGSLASPKYKKDANGQYLMNEDGTIQIEDSVKYKQKSARHCRALRKINTAPNSLPMNYRGIIDDVCNTWSGYSKNGLTLSAGVVQCFENTMRNLFEKPMPTSNIGVILTSEQKTKYAQYSNDAVIVGNAIKNTDNITQNSQNDGYSLTQDLNNLETAIAGINSRALFGSLTQSIYITRISKITTIYDKVSPVVPTAFYDNIAQINKDLNVLLNEISASQTTFMAEALASNSSNQALTPFQSLQGTMQAFVTILLICYIMMIGYRMINGTFSPNITNVIPIFLEIAIVYYFAMGNAWRDYFFNMILSASKGLGQFAMEITADYEAKSSDKCNFMDAFYLPDNPNEKCNFPNMSISSNQDRYVQQIVHYNLKNKKPYKGCMRGPFIPRPNYENVYIPVEYTGISSDYDLTQTQYLQVYCFDKNNTTNRIAAILQTNQITGKAKRWICPKDYIMEDGYRPAELLNLGINNLSNVKTDKYGVINTSINILDYEGNIINIVQGIVNPEIQVLTSVEKYSRVRVLENVRAHNNINYRQYPIIQQYGVSRNMDYVGMFDTLDCKVMRYLGYNANNSDDVLSVKFLIGMLWAGPLGIAIMILTLFIGFLFISMVGRVVQGYLVSIGAITILLYLSPLVMPCMLFPETKGYYNTWFDKIKQYATGIPISLLTIGVMVIFTDYIFYGSPAEYDYYSVFNDNGTVNGSCGLIDPENAPLICLFNIMSGAVWSTSCVFGSCVTIGDNFWKYIGVLIIKSMRAIIVLNVIMDSLGKIEDFMGSILGVSADTTLNGSIFNSNTGLFNQMKSRALATMQMPIDIASDIKDKISTTRKMMDEAKK